MCVLGEERPNRSALVCLGCRNKIPQTLWLKPQKIIFFTVLDAGTFKIKVQQCLISGEGALPDLQMATISLCPHMVERETSTISSSFCKGTSCTRLGPTLFNPYHLLTSPISKHSHLRVRALTYEFWRNTNDQSTTRGKEIVG